MIISEEEIVFIEEHVPGDIRLVEEDRVKELLVELYAYIRQYDSGLHGMNEIGEEAEEVMISIEANNISVFDDIY